MSSAACSRVTPSRKWPPLAGRSGRPLVFGKGDNPINFVSVIDVAAVVEHA